MALAVLVFHYDKWLTGVWDASTLQGKLGVYAVSIFFVLSGLTLTLSYQSRLQDTLQSWVSFFRKRFWRIFPLLWLATAFTLLLEENPRSLGDICLNFTGLFGWLNPARDIATGAWSIGCELVYYGLFPPLLFLAQRNRTAFTAIFIVFLSMGIWASFTWFSEMNTDQKDWWEAYVQAGNHAFFFVGGMMIGIFKPEGGLVPIGIWRRLFGLSMLGLICWPIGTEAFHLISGQGRMVLSLLTLCLVATYFFSKIELAGYFHQAFSWLGAVSYSLYLLHPLVYRAVGAVYRKFEIPESYGLVFLPALVAALILSHFSYYFLEKPLMRRA